jgi:hypothetical protein
MKKMVEPPCKGLTRRDFITLAGIMALAAGCGKVLPISPSATSTETPIPSATATETPTPSQTPTITPTETPTETPNVEATATAEFEAKKAEALSMVSIKLESPEDFATLPLLDDVNDFDSGKVQEAEYWLIDNVLPPVDLQLPKSWRISCEQQIGFCRMAYNVITESNLVIYRGVGAFFVMRDGKKMLRLGFEYGGKDQLIHFNYEDPRWWTDPALMEVLIACFNHIHYEISLVVQYGSLNTPEIYNEIYKRKITLERSRDGNQFFKDWISNRQLPEWADRTVFGGSAPPLIEK